MKESIEILDNAIDCLGEPPFGEGVKRAAFKLQELEKVDCKDWPDDLRKMRDELLEDCETLISLMREPISHGNVDTQMHATEKNEVEQRIAQEMEILRARLKG
ncbi:MAG TPA: hypothetical protein DIU37_05505 [Opitutae bacterium]|nr:hypothetical protein [Opitutae bacterium]|tara:strand:+ start:4223 stop:4531 length:309 start_codon:yes stop_codon:yes gene_type:complete